MAVYVVKPIQFDWEKAVTAVSAQGSPRQRARLAGVLGASVPDREVVAELERLQNPDGGFPEREVAESPSNLAATCRVLAQLRQMPPLAGSPMASRAVAFLRRNQEFDGSWRWGGDDRDLTARVAYTICILDPSHSDPVTRASRWLRTRFADAQAVDGLSPRTMAYTWALWVALQGEGDPEARRLFRMLDQREIGAEDLALWLLLALEVGAGGPYLLPLVRRLGDLAGRQRADGLWPADDDPVETTLNVLWVFRLSGLIQEGGSGGAVGGDAAQRPCGAG